MKKKKTNWISDLKNKGYKYIMSINGDVDVYASKANMKKDGSFPDNSNWDLYTLEPGESWPKNRKTKKFYFIGD